MQAVREDVTRPGEKSEGSLGPPGRFLLGGESRPWEWLWAACHCLPSTSMFSNIWGVHTWTQGDAWRRDQFWCTIFREVRDREKDPEQEMWTFSHFRGRILPHLGSLAWRVRSGMLTPGHCSGCPCFRGATVWLESEHKLPTVSKPGGKEAGTVPTQLQSTQQALTWHHV